MMQAYLSELKVFFYYSTYLKQKFLEEKIVNIITHNVSKTNKK